MFISQLQEKKNEKVSSSLPSASLLPSAKGSTALRPANSPSKSFRKDSAYRFEVLEHMLKACQRLCGMNGICESTAYRDENGCYFLFLTFFSGSPFSIPEEFDFIAEYGRVENAAVLRLYIREHATSICEHNAIQSLAKLA